MARPLRIEYPGAFYHITARGNRKGDIFSNTDDRFLFNCILGETIATHNWRCHAYVQMGNHYHILIETLDANLSSGMRDLNGNYSQALNKRNKTTGHLLQGRFKAFLIEEDDYLLEVARYIDLNPVRAGLVKNPAEWSWSSFKAHIGLEMAPSWLHTDSIWRRFSGDNRLAREKYRKFVQDGIGLGSPFETVGKGIILGSQYFVDHVSMRVDPVVQDKNIPRAERLFNRPSLELIFDGVGKNKSYRNLAIRVARLSCGYPVKEIADYVGLTSARISKVVHMVKS